VLGQRLGLSGERIGELAALEPRELEGQVIRPARHVNPAFVLDFLRTKENGVEVTICYHQRPRPHRTCVVHRSGQLETPFAFTRLSSTCQSETISEPFSGNRFVAPDWWPTVGTRRRHRAHRDAGRSGDLDCAVVNSPRSRPRALRLAGNRCRSRRPRRGSRPR